MKKVLLLAIIAVFALTLSACGSDDGVVTIGANIYTYNDNFMNGVVRPELERYAEELGVELDVVDSEGDQAKLNDQVDVFIDKGVDVLAINLVDPAAAKTIIEKAKAADIPLILFNKEATEAGIMDTYDKVWYVGTDSAEAGIIQGEMMVADWQANASWDLNSDGVLDYVLLKGEPGHPDAEARTLESVKAFTDAGITVNELALAASPTWSTADAKNTMDAWLTSAFADQIELVICNNDGMAFGAFQALDAADKVLPVYGVDALDQALTMIGDGELNGTVLNDGVNQARATIDLAINAANGDDIVAGTEWVIDSPTGTKAVRVAYVAVTADNYEDFQ
jgi:methyl-galactoside transport system substrate-binding protein